MDTMFIFVIAKDQQEAESLADTMQLSAKVRKKGDEWGVLMKHPYSDDGERTGARETCSYLYDQGYNVFLIQPK
jgi:hypothetical protein